MNEIPSQYSEALVTCDWLEAHLNDPDLVIFDCTTYLVPSDGPTRPYDIQSGKADYDEGHIPGAGYFDLQKDFSVADSPYRFTLPSAQETAAIFARHGVSDGKRVVLYSRKNLQWATRFWWMLRWLGFDNVSILDGGYDKWVADGRMTSTTQCEYQTGQFSINLRPEVFVGKEVVQSAIGAAEVCTINALAADLHRGENPRYGRPGRVPGSVNVPATTLFNPETIELLPIDTVAQAFAGIGADTSKRIIVYCGGGIAATLDAFVLHELGYRDIAVYDNSMSEWANDISLPIETD
ncbi:sulfurtransferase [Sneathiella sp. CAU 1612]|uniref:Sulfurtransferase n=1 Tax=Sneathiella sedimenti TaxID=2816034 RepID=A0ABS3FA62_9PROT|nr:sulfurtransferase [Sneathiella sedimenti]MBO0335353.1 sulfurtransferase [Sneathiella sedimenti]